jgi:hypothetical protein
MDLSPTSSPISSKTLNAAENGFSKASSFYNNLPTPIWFDDLENEFDKAFVDLDVLLGEFEQDHVIFKIFIYFINSVRFNL